MAIAQDYATTDSAPSFEVLEISEMEGKYLSFWTDRQLFAVPIADVVQIVGMQEITELPETPYYVKGIMNLRGSIIPIIDVRLRLGKPEKEYDERTCIIVTSIYDTAMGFIVDAVDEVSSIDPDQISPPPQMSADQASSFLTGVAKRAEHVVLLISALKLLGKEEATKLSESILEGAPV